MAGVLDTPAKNTRGNKTKRAIIQEGQTNLNCTSQIKEGFNDLTPSTSPGLDSQGRARHTSRNLIKSGSVNAIKKKLEPFAYLHDDSDCATSKENQSANLNAKLFDSPINKILFSNHEQGVNTNDCTFDNTLKLDQLCTGDKGIKGATVIGQSDSQELNVRDTVTHHEEAVMDSETKKVTNEDLASILTGMKDQITTVQNTMTNLETRMKTVETSLNTTMMDLSQIKKDLGDKADKEDLKSKVDVEMFEELQSRVSKEHTLMQSLVDIVKYQELRMKELQQEVTETRSAVHRCTLTINGLPRVEGEDCIHTVTTFFQRMLNIEENIPITKAYRVGGKHSQSIQIALENPVHKGLIFKNAPKLKGKKNVDKKSFSIYEPLPGEKNEQQKRKQRN